MKTLKSAEGHNERGVPNYFGAQRFGIGGSNLQGALRWAQSDAPVRDRNKRSFWLSAARSALFNQIVSERLKKPDVNQVVVGDALQLAGRGSWFVATAEEMADVAVARGCQSADDYRSVAGLRRLGNPEATR